VGFSGECFSEEAITHSEAIAPVPPSVEVVSFVEVPPSVELVVPVVVIAEVTHVEVPPSVEVSVVEVQSMGAPQLTESAFEVAYGAVRVLEDDGSTTLQNFVNIITKDIQSPLLDKSPPRRRVDPILHDAHPQLPSSEAFGPK
jgi:hypothetical protein